MKKHSNPITQDDLPFLTEDVSDYLFEKEANIGTNFLDTFPNSYIEENQIILVDSDNKIQAVITISLPAGFQNEQFSN